MDTQPLPLDGFTDETIVDSGLGQPISLAFLPDNRILVIEKSGTIRIVDPETGQSSVYMQINNINDGGERGLLDITLDPDFANNGYIYLYYTPANPARAVIARFEHRENAGGLTSFGDTNSRTVLWTDVDKYLTCCHYGAGLDFGIDGKLWLTASDKFTASAPGDLVANADDLPVDLTSTTGKVIRVNKDGSIPDGTDGWPANPYVDASGDPNGDIPDSIWAYGLRNPFRASWDEEYEAFFIAEVGGNQLGLSSDSIHLATLDQPGVFYGWPFYEGEENVLVNPNKPDLRSSLPAPDQDLGDPANGDFYSAPIFSYPRESGASITGGEVYRGTLFPDEWDGVYFYGDFTRDEIRYLQLDETGRDVLGDFAFAPTSDIPGSTPNIVYLGVGNDGALYYINYSVNGGEIHRITYESDNTAPSINSTDVQPNPSASTLDFDFAADVSDVDGDALTYSWNLGDGTVITGAPDVNGNISFTHAYAIDGFYTASLSVSDGQRTVFSTPVTIEAGDPNNPPQIISTDVDDAFADVGQTLTFTATVDDVDGGPLTYVWSFGDGTTATGSVPVSGTFSVTHAYTSEALFDATLSISDGEDTTTSIPVRVNVGEVTGVGVTDGLVLALESTIKIGLDGDQVLAWLDGSGAGNNLTASGDPRLVDNATPTGAPAIVFDGDGDRLDRVDSTATPIAGLPAGSGARTLFFVVDYGPTGGTWQGATYGNDANDQAFGLTANGQNGQFAVQAWGGGNDDTSPVDAIGAGWVVQSVVLQDDGLLRALYRRRRRRHRIQRFQHRRRPNRHRREPAQWRRRDERRRRLRL